MPKLTLHTTALLLAPLMLAACATPSTDGPTAPTTSTPSQDGIARARIGERVYVDGPYVTPLAILEDSRCPDAPGVRCVWAGQVRLSVRVELGRGPSEHELNSRTPLQIADGNLQLVEVTPARGVGDPAKPDDYVFGFKFMGGY